MAKTRKTARRPPTETYVHADYGLQNDEALIPPPVRDDETSPPPFEDDDDETSTVTTDHETQNTPPSETITETTPTAASAAITEIPASEQQPVALAETTTENPTTQFIPPRSTEALIAPTISIINSATTPSEDIETTIAPSGDTTGTEISNGPSITTAPTESPIADLDARPDTLNYNRPVQDTNMNFPLTPKIDFLDKDYLLNNILENNELCFISLKNLCESYFQHKQLVQLGNLTYGSAEDANGKNASFFVCIGKREGYNSVLKSPFNSRQRSDSNKALFIDKLPDYQNLFVTFLNGMFKKDNLDILNDTYTRDDILTISLFYRETSKHPTTKKIVFTDHLIGVASIVQDDQPSCLLVWIGIVPVFPCKKRPNVGAWGKKTFDNMRGAINIGMFLICTIQWIKSILVGQWTPVTCQVFLGAKTGPLYFYKKSYFIRLNRDHDLIHFQYLRRREHIIDDDKTLHWYALFYPLQFLTMYMVNSMENDQESIGIIMNRANYFFLTQKTHSYPVDEVVPHFEQYFGTSLNNNASIQITKTLPDIQLDNSNNNLWLRSVTDENQQIQQVFATSAVLNKIFEVNENIKLKTMNFYESDNDVSNPEDSIFLLASKVFFGSASYHYIIRQFFYFMYKSLSKLRPKHHFFENIMPEIVDLIIQRTYSNPERYGFNDLRDNNSLPETIQEMQEKKTGKILKMYYVGLLNLYAESFLRPKFQGEECDIFFLKEIFNSSLSIINVTSSDTTPFKANYVRSYDIKIHQSNAVPFTLIDYVSPITDYIKGIPIVNINSILKHIWLARVDKNDLYIMTVTDEYEEKILQLPSSVGGCELFIVEEDVAIEDDEAIAFQFDKSLDFIIDRVEQESSASETLKIIEEYIKTRKWKTFKKLFKSTKGGKLKDNDPDNLSIGPLFEIGDLSAARVDNDLVMPIFRILDPWHQVFYSKTQAIRNKISYGEIITFRRETWLSDCAIECFLDILNDTKKGFSSKIWVLSNSKFQFVIQSQQSIQTFINKLPSDCSQLLILIHSDGHYVMVEVAIPSTDAKEVSVYIADSTNDEVTLDELSEEVRYANVDLLVASFNPRLPIKYKKARDVVKQTNDYDCGVCCCQRAYFYKRFAHPNAIPEHCDYLKETVTFRVFMLEEILKRYRNQISPLVYYASPIHRPVMWRPLINTTVQESSNLEDTITNATSIVNDEMEGVNSVVEEANIERRETPLSNDNERKNNDEVNVSEANTTLITNIENTVIQTSTNLNLHEKDHQDQYSDVNEEVSNEASGNQHQQILPNLNHNESSKDQKHFEKEQNPTDLISHKSTVPRKAVSGGKGLFILGQAAGSGSGDDESGSGSGSGDDDDSDTATEAIIDAEDGSDEDHHKKVSEMEDDDDGDEEYDSDYIENTNVGSDNTTKVTTQVSTRANKITIRKIVGQTEPDTAEGVSSSENDETSEQETQQQRRKKKISPKQSVKQPKTSVGRSKDKSVGKSKKKSVTFDVDKPKKKQVYGNKIKNKNPKPAKVATIKERTEQFNKKRKLAEDARITMEKETLREARLSTINNEIDRWETWHDVHPETLEIDIFSDDPNYFINKKVPAKVQAELNNDLNFIKTKMYEPIQYDYDRAKLAVDAEFHVATGVAAERYANAEKALEAIKDQPNSAKYKKLQKTVFELRERKKFLKYTTDTLAELLPFDAVYGIRMKQESNKKEYYVIAHLPDGSFKEKLVTRAWIEKHVEKDYLDRYFQAEDERGWILFTQEDADGKLLSDTNELRQLLRDKDVQPVYQYKIDDDDEKIECVRCAITFKSPYHRLIPSSINWAIMTEKNSVSKNSLGQSPWNNKDENDQKHHIYWDCKETLLQAALGELFDLINSAIEQHYNAEYRQQGRPHMKPRFHFGNNPHVEFLQNEGRFIDECDLSKGSFLKQRPAVFNKNYCGIFSNRQYYYFDMRDVATNYFINVSTRQICGIYYDPSSKQYTGLERFRERGHQKFKKVALETEWVRANIDKAVRTAAVTKSKADHRRFIKLPVGLGRPHQSLKETMRNPKIHYPQYGDDTCVFSSLSSALHYLQYQDVALRIDDFKLKIMKEQFDNSFENLMGRITGYIHDDKCFGSFRKQCERKKITHCANYDLIIECKKKQNVLHHVVTISQDGGENHAICVVHNLIFDGNFSNALPLSQEYLDIACNSTYLGIASGYKYTFNNL
jgi:hypothetical protein